MIEIVKQSEPVQLTYLRKNCSSRGLDPTSSYAELRNPDKQAVLESLLKEQGHLCAYCMCRIPMDEAVIGATIEHFVPLRPHNYRDVGQGLDYNNMYAVCPGNEVWGKNNDPSALTCDSHKRNTELTKLNPQDKATLDSIYYTLSGEIHSTDNDVEIDLTDILNLNSKRSPLIDERKETLSSLIAGLNQYKDDLSELDKWCKLLLNEYENELDPKTPYVGVLIYYLRTMIAATETSK